MQELLEKAATIALQAGELILAIKDKTASQKADGSPVTKADLEANAFITDRLSHIAPYPICSEEAPLEYEKRKDLEYFWLVDPLDGTKDFVANLSGWSVNIALIHRDKAILGVVYVPMLKELYLGLEGFGAFRYAMDSALGRHSADLANFGATADLKSSSAPKFAKSYESPTAIPRILEEGNQAEREKSTHSLESSFDKSQKMDCHADKSARNDRENNAHASKSTARANTKNTTSKKVDSRDKAFLSSLRASETSVAIHTNTQKIATLESTFENPTNVSEQPKDSRICDEKSLLCEPRKEIRLECLSTQRGDAIKDLSRKAESSSQKNSAIPLACDSVFHSSPLTQAFIAHYGLESIKLGSSLKFCALANGAADIYPRFNGTKEWDTAASQVIVEQSGGAVISIKTGKPLRYNKKHFANDYFIAFAASQIGGAIYEDVRSDRLLLAFKASYYGLVVWLTGLAGSGKSTLAKELYIKLQSQALNVVYLDGDELRDVLGAYSYDKQGRISVAKKRADLARLLSRQGIITIVSTISMFDEIYAYNREHFPNYLEVYVSCDYDELIRRDQKQLYSKALKGEQPNVVGVDIDYDEPKAHLRIDNTTLGGIDEKVKQILEKIQSTFQSTQGA